jgi:glycosyltransferase involved in cell wall biosynthesis
MSWSAPTQLTRYLRLSIAPRSILLPEDERVHATGPLPHETILELFRAADVVVLPAVWQEPFPRVLLEAMSASRSSRTSCSRSELLSAV